MNRLKFSLSSRWASLAIVSNTIDDFPEPETPVKIVILRFGMRRETLFKLFSRAPRISIYSWGISNLVGYSVLLVIISFQQGTVDFGNHGLVPIGLQHRASLKDF